MITVETRLIMAGLFDFAIKCLIRFGIGISAWIPGTERQSSICIPHCQETLFIMPCKNHGFGCRKYSWHSWKSRPSFKDGKVRGWFCIIYGFYWRNKGWALFIKVLKLILKCLINNAVFRLQLGYVYSWVYIFSRYCCTSCQTLFVTIVSRAAFLVY